MSDEQSALATPVPASVSLREARERAGLHVAALASMLKVPVQRLEALEAGRYDELPDMTFVRALASSVCRVLKMDPGPVLASLPASAAVRLGEPEGALNAPMPTRQAPLLSGAASADGRRRMPVSLVMALAVLVAAGVLWFLLPQRDSQPPVVAEPLAALVPERAEDAPAATAAETPAEPRADAPAAQPVVVDAVAVSAPTGVLPAAAVEQPAAATADILQLRAREATWVQVTGASGRVLLQRGLQAGEVVGFSSDLPLAVVVGRADETVVTVRGQALDLAPLTRNNVARFEVR